jgi:peptidoglycan/xylan/chitin deacetylase (PgdA/CDA1 family)
LPIALPSSKRCAVCVTFDFDAVSLWFGMFKSFDSQAIGRGEFGPRVGAPRLLDLLERRGVPTTWFVPGHTAESWPSVTRAVAAAGHEIAHHGWCHEPPPGLGEAEEGVLVRGIESLERVAGERPLGYRAPSWTVSDRTIELLLEHGFTYAANGMAEDFRPYRARIGDRASLTEPFRYGEETDLVDIPSAWHLTDCSQLEVGPPWNLAPAPGHAEQIWKDEFDYMYEHVEGGVITYAFHPECIGRGHRLPMLDRLLEHIGRHDDVWFARTIEIANAWSPDPPGLWAGT